MPRLPFLVPLQSVLGFLPLLARPSQLPANGERITFHKVVPEMKDIRDTQALQALFGKLDERLGPVIDQVLTGARSASSRLSTRAFQVA